MPRSSESEPREDSFFNTYIQGKPTKQEVKDEVESESEKVEDEDDDHCRDPSLVSTICDAKFSRLHGELLYRVVWYKDGVMRKTWETESDMKNLTKDPLVDLALFNFEESKPTLIKTLRQKKVEFERNKSGPGWVYEEREGKQDEPEVFYGANTDELAGETARLFDPSHKFTETEKMLAKVNTLPGKRLTRSQLNNARTVNDGSDGSAPGSRSNTPVLSVRGRKSRGTPKTPPARRGRGRKSKVASRDEQQDENVKIENVSDEPIIQEFVPSGEDYVDDTPTTSERDVSRSSKSLKTPTHRQGPARKRVIVYDDDLDSEDTPTPVKGPLITNKPIPQETRQDAVNKSPSAAPPTPPATTSTERAKKRQLVGRRILPLDAIGITPAMVEEASKPMSDIRRIVMRKARDEMAEEVDKMASSHQKFSIQQGFTSAILAGDIRRARQFVAFHKECHMSSDFNINYTERLTGQNLLHKVCQISCNDAKVRRPDYMHALCDIAEYLIVLGLDPRHTDALGKTPLQYAIDKKIICRVRRLLALRAPVNLKGIALKDSPLYQSYISNHRPIFKLLLDNGADFAPLHHEILLEKVPSNKFIKDDLKKHFDMLKYRFKEAKRKVLIDIEEVHTASPIYMANFYEGPEFCFDFHYKAEHIPTADWFFVLFVATAAVDDSNRWHLALWGDSPLETEPMLNNEAMTPIQYIEQFGPMNTSSKKSAIFLGTPCVGANRIRLSLNQSKGPPPLGDAFQYSMCLNWKVVVQMSLLRRSRQRMIPQPGPFQRQTPGLEHAPDAPSSYY